MESNVRSKFQVNVARDLAAEKSFVALQRLEHCVDILAAERHDVDRREPQVGAHAYLRDGDEMAFEHGIVHLAARQQIGHRMADELADAQLALRAAGRGFTGMLVLGHLFRCLCSLWPGVAVRRTASLRSPMPGHPRLPYIFCSRRGCPA